jgi:hypothetical protein
MMDVKCNACDRRIEFSQPYVYHAGFGDSGFLYDEAGTCTLVWSSYDPTYVDLVGQCHPWALSAEQRSIVEEALGLAPSGGRWLFANPPRCTFCGSPIGDPIATGNIYYFVYPGSVLLDGKTAVTTFRSALRSSA